jgi:hypothetical protein
MTPEGKIKKEIKAGLAGLAVYQYWPVPTGYGSATIDLYVCYKGHFFAFEVKRRDGGKLTARQSRVLHEVRVAGGTSRVVTSWDEVRLALEYPT